MCVGFNDMTEKSMSFINIAVISVRGIHYKAHIWFMTKREAVNKMKNTDLREKSRQL